MYVETDFLLALVKDDDWLGEPAHRALDGDADLRTSILAYAEIMVLLYDREAGGYDIDVPRAVANLLELVPVAPKIHEEAVLAAASFVDEYELTPFDALHAGIVATRDEPVLSSESAYERVGLELHRLDDDLANADDH